MWKGGMPKVTKWQWWPPRVVFVRNWGGEAPDFSIFMGNLEGVLSLELGAHKG